MWPPSLPAALIARDGGAGEAHQLRWGLDLIQGWGSPTNRVQLDQLA